MVIVNHGVILSLRRTANALAERPRSAEVLSEAKENARGYLLVSALTLAACSGNFSTGTSPPNTIPAAQATLAPAARATGSAAPGAQAPAGSATYPLSQAQSGFICPSTLEGYSCELRFNLPSPIPSETPSPSPSPSSSSSSTPSPAPSISGPALTMHASALPADAPKMVHVPLNVLTTVPLMMVTLSVSADFKLTGPATASFTLPKEQIPNRGFALQLFLQRIQKKTTTYTPIWTFDKSSLKETTLTFGFIPPKMTIAKGVTYVLVLYGDEISSPSPSPRPTVKASPSLGHPSTGSG